MSKASRRYNRTVLLSLAAMGVLIWAAIDQFDLSTQERGALTISSMSSSSAQFSTTTHNSIRKGHRLKLEILVSTPMPVKVDKIAVVRNVKGKKIGCFFLSGQNDDKLRAAGLI